MLDESKLLSGEKLPLMERLKLLIYKTLQKHAFVAIFLLASVSVAGLDQSRFPIPYLILLASSVATFWYPSASSSVQLFLARPS